MELAALERLAAAADDNFVAHLSVAARVVPGMRVLEASDLTLVDSGLPCDTFNCVCRARLTAASADGRIEEAMTYFRSAGRPYAWWLAPGDRPRDLGDRLAAAGLERSETELAMAADLGLLSPDGPASPSLTVRRVRSEAELEQAAGILAANWTPPDTEVLRFYERAAAVLLHPDCEQRYYLACLEEEPVATAEITIGGGVAGVYNISTRQRFRRQGIGTAVTRHALLDARAAGPRIAVLQAAPEGVGIYTKLGFAAFGEITEYKPPRPSVA